MRSAARAAFLLGLLGPLGCGNAPSVAPAPAAPAGGSPAAVTPVRPERQSLMRVVEQPGTVQPFEETQLFAKVSGYVARIHADIGQRVRGPKFDSSTGRPTDPGEVLAELSIPELTEEVRQKQAAVRQAEAEAVQSEKALLSAEAHVGAAEANAAEAVAGIARAQAQLDRWESEASRIADMVRRGVVDAQTRDETFNQRKAAEAARDEAKARVGSAEALVRKAKTDKGKAEADVKAVAARVEVAQADAARVAALASYAAIRAPYDGVVTRRRVQTGDLVAVPGGKGEPLFAVARLDPVRLVVHVPEADAALVRDGSEAKLTVPALKGVSLSGKVARTSWALEPGTRTLRAEVDVANTDGRLRPGMYLYAHLSTRLPEEWTLPAAALVKQGDATVCFVIEGGKLVRTPVQTGHSDGQRTEVLRRQKPGSPPTWVPFVGDETVAARAAGLVDGQVLP